MIGPDSIPVGVVLMENGDPAYDEIPSDRSDNLYDEIHPRTDPAHSDEPSSSLDSEREMQCVSVCYCCVCIHM